MARPPISELLIVKYGLKYTPFLNFLEANILRSNMEIGKRGRAISGPASLFQPTFLIRVISSSSRKKWIPGAPHDLFFPETSGDSHRVK